jgi:hypothetical protein
MIASEGLFTDLCNTMYVGSSNMVHRSQAVIDAYLEAVPKDMLDVPWKKLNRAHHLKQGARRSSKVPCAVELCPYGKRSTCLAGRINGRLIYVCGIGCSSHLQYRRRKHPTWELQAILDDVPMVLANFISMRMYR